MKRIALLLSVLALSGCAEKTYRTGMIFVDGFNVDTYGSGRPMAVRDNVVKRITDELATDLNRTILRDSRLYYASSCAQGNYRLAGTISRIDSHPRKDGVPEFDDYSLECRGALFRCDDGSVIDAFTVRAEKGPLDGAIASLAEGIVAEIK